MSRDLERRLARAEIAASTTDWADRQAANHRKELRTRVRICQLIRERFLLMGLDPALAAALELGERAAAELAAIPDSEALRMADEAITSSDPDDHGEAWRKSQAQLARIAMNMGVYKGPQPDFANASLTELVAFCVAIEKLAWDQ